MTTLDSSGLVADAWLFELALHGPVCAQVAQQLLRTSAVIANRYGHILDFGHEPGRRRILAAARYNIIPTLKVRCLRCDVYALLPDWVAASKMSKQARESTMWKVYTSGQEARYRFMEPCEGGKEAAVLSDLIDTLKQGEE